MSDYPRILIVDDDPIVAESLAEFLQKESYECATACNGNEAMAMLDAKTNNGFGIVVTDVNMPRCDGMELLKYIRKLDQSVAVIMITGFGKIESAVDAVKLGANEYLTKPIVDDELRMAISKAARQHVLLAENQTLKSQLTDRHGLDNIVGSDYRMQRVYGLVEAVAESNTTVLLEGESGTGKSLIARAIHTYSPRQAGPFVTFSCGAIPETLLESELFGHVKGAFTGASSDKPGKCLAAYGGTLFIDEINSATPALQLKLLRVLQEKQFEPVGSNKTVMVDVRFVLSTNQSLTELVAQGEFREDLYYRINVVSIHMPPLRDRVGDISILADHFLSKYCRELNRQRTLNTETLQVLRAYHWPGNVRELENAIERAVVLSRGPVIVPSDLPDSVFVSDCEVVGAASMVPSTLVPAANSQPQPISLAVAMQDPEKRIILSALQANNWNRQATARELDVNRTTLYKKIKQYGLTE